MGKHEIKAEIAHCESMLNSSRKELANLEEQVTALQEVADNCNSRIAAFSSSIERRRKKLLNFDSMLETMKSAKRYKNKMTDMLYNQEYSNTTSSIDKIENAIKDARTKLLNKINDVENQIYSLERRIDHLRAEYERCLREEAMRNEQSQ